MVPQRLTAAREHIAARMEAEHRLLGKVRESLEVEDQQVTAAAARIAGLLAECSRRHDALHRQVITARSVFLEEQDRQSFLPPAMGYLPDLGREVLTPLLGLDSETALLVTDRWLSDVTGPRPPKLPRLYRLIYDLWAVRDLIPDDRDADEDNEAGNPDPPTIPPDIVHAACRVVARTGLTNAILHGLHACVLSDGDFGLVLGVSPESPFVFRVSDIPHAATRTGRLMAGLVLVGVAAYAYPTPSELDEDRIRRVADVEFEQWLRAACERMQVHDAAGEPVPDEGLDEAWRAYHEMPSTLVGDKGRGAGRLSPKCTLYWVRNILGWLVEQGMARADGAGGTWTLTERFRIQVKDMASEPAYTFLAEVARHPGGPPNAPESTVEGSEVVP